MTRRFEGCRGLRRAVLLGVALVTGCQGLDAPSEPEPGSEPTTPSPDLGVGQTPAPELPAPRPPEVTPGPVPPPVKAPGLDARRPWWRASYHGGVSPQSLAVGDFTGDGLPDVVVGARGGNHQGRWASSQGSLRVLRGDGRGGLSLVYPSHALVGPTGSLAVGDVNGDGRLDVLTGTRFDSQIWLGQGTGALVEPGRERRVGTEPSVNLGVWKGEDGESLPWHLGLGEGLGGVVSAPRFVLARLSGDRFLEQWEPLPGDLHLRNELADDVPSLRAAVADFNEDGLLDAVFSQDQSMAGSTEVSRVFLGGDSGRLVAGDALYPLRPFRRVSTADFNRDGHVDLLVLYPDARSVGVLLGTGRGTFSPVAALPLPDPASEVAALEWSGDGVPDIVALHDARDSASLLEGRGDGGFTWYGGLAVGRLPSAVAVADLDADGRPELLVAEQGDNTVSVYTPPDALQSRPVLPALCPWPPRSEEPVAMAPVVGRAFEGRVGGTVSVAAGDFDSDGKMDLALTQYQGGALVMGHEKEGSHALWQLEGLRERYVSQLAVGDFDGDGRADLAGIYQPNGWSKPPYVPVIFWNDARSSFSEMLELTRWNDQVGLVAADFNQDGLTDIALAFAGDSTGSASRWTSLGQRRFHRELLPGLNPTQDPANPSLTLPALTAGNLTADGTKTLIHTTTTGFTLSPTSGPGALRPAQGYGVALAQHFSVIADVDGDGRADVLSSEITSNHYPDHVRVMRGDGQGSLGSPLDCALPRRGHLVEWKDLNGDGIEDALLVGGSTVWAMLRTADGKWKALVPHDVAGASHYFVRWTASVDLEGDARPELLVFAQGGTLWIFPPPEA